MSLLHVQTSQCTSASQGVYKLPLDPSSDFSKVQFTQSCPTLCDPMNHCVPGLLSITNSQSPPKPMSIESVMPSNHLILCRPLLLLPSFFPSIRVFSNESAFHIGWPKYWSFSFKSSKVKRTSLVAQTVKHLATMRETWVQSLSQEDLLEKEMATHSSTLAWKIPWTEEPGRLQSMESQRVGHD